MFAFACATIFTIFLYYVMCVQYCSCIISWYTDRLNSVDSVS